MSKTVNVTIPIAPVAKGRPRFGVVNGKPRVWTPKKTADFEAQLAAAVYAELGNTQLEGPLWLDAQFVLPRPKRLMRKKDPDEAVWAPKRPDLDNLTKAVLDALSPFWGDDAQVCDMRLTKVYAEKTGAPRVQLTMGEWE